MTSIGSAEGRGQADTPVLDDARAGAGDTVLKFNDPDTTASGLQRATVPFDRLATLWINTGTLCNITCRNCYIDSSPTNDRLVYITAAETADFLDEIARDDLGAIEIAFTGGEPFMNPDMLAMARDVLTRGHRVLILTNAMQPMQRPTVAAGLQTLVETFGARLALRVSLDHATSELHDVERGTGSFARAVAGLDWLAAIGATVAIAGRTCWGESPTDARAAYARLIAAHRWPVDAADPTALVLLPEMDGALDVPEITTACWDILHKRPSSVMCATSRMVVKRRGADRPTVVPCTLLPYEPAFEMGSTLREAAATDGGMFDRGAVKLCHPHCARFCVLGGGSCS